MINNTAAYVFKGNSNNLEKKNENLIIVKDLIFDNIKRQKFINGINQNKNEIILPPKYNSIPQWTIDFSNCYYFIKMERVRQFEKKQNDDADDGVEKFMIINFLKSFASIKSLQHIEILNLSSNIYEAVDLMKLFVSLPQRQFLQLNLVKDSDNYGWGQKELFEMVENTKQIEKFHINMLHVFLPKASIYQIFELMMKQQRKQLIFENCPEPVEVFNFHYSYLQKMTRNFVKLGKFLKIRKFSKNQIQSVMNLLIHDQQHYDTYVNKNLRDQGGDESDNSQESDDEYNLDEKQK